MTSEEAGAGSSSRSFPSWTILYAAALLVFVCVCQFGWAVVAPDCDLWYHLNVGRFIWQHRAIPHDSFFSFLSPPRRYHDYYWLFQLLTYGIYSVFNYQGLVILRASLCSATLAGIALFLFQGNLRRPAVSHCLAFAAYVAFLIYRSTLVRPHLFSYFFIVASLYILEYHPRRAAALPFLALLWVNLHGISYPIYLLIAGAYVAEYFYARLRSGQAASSVQQKTLALTVLSMAVCFLTPLGVDLVSVPFDTVFGGYVNWHVGEVVPLHAGDFLTFNIVNLIPDQGTAFNFILYLALAALLAAIARKQIRVSHLLLFACAVCFLPKLRRFQYECALLALPLLKSSSPVAPEARTTSLPRPVMALALIVLLAMPFRAAWATLSFRPHYPMSLRKLPHGVAAFLNQIHDHGAVLNDPDVGGYLEWSLEPAYKIGIDMQLVTIFDENDLYLMHEAFVNPALFKLLVSRYHPEFVAAPRSQPKFKDIVKKFPQYVCIFFDDQTVLYVEKTQRPSLARAHALPVDAYAPPEPGADKTPKEKSACGLPTYLARILAYDPHIFRAQILAAKFCAANKDFHGQARYGESLVRDYPEEGWGYALQGAAQREGHDLRRSMAVLREGLSIVRWDRQDEILQEMYRDYRALNQPPDRKTAEFVRDFLGRTLPLTWPETEKEYSRGRR